MLRTKPFFRNSPTFHGMLAKTLPGNESMQPSLRSTLLIAILLAASLACNAVTHLFVLETPEPYVPPAPAPVTSTPEADAEALACPLVTDKILDAATRYYEEEPVEENNEDPEELYLVTYSVSGDQISAPFYEEVPADLAGYQEDINGQKEIWHDFVTLIPAVDRSALAEYSVVTDGEGNILAAVAQTAFDPARWSLEVDIRDVGDKLNLTYTLIHEFAHLLTLGPGQVTPSEAVFNHPDDDNIFFQEVSACPDYFPGEGCSRSNSYINAFYNEFWADIYVEWQDINLIEDNDAYYEALDDFLYQIRRALPDRLRSHQSRGGYR